LSLQIASIDALSGFFCRIRHLSDPMLTLGGELLGMPTWRRLAAGNGDNRNPGPFVNISQLVLLWLLGK
jgi:hypothetical protein